MEPIGIVPSLDKLEDREASQTDPAVTTLDYHSPVAYEEEHLKRVAA